MIFDGFLGKVQRTHPDALQLVSTSDNGTELEIQKHLNLALALKLLV